MSPDLDDASGASTLEEVRLDASRQLVELTRRNPSAISMDILYLLTIAFFTILATKAWGLVGVPGIGIVIPFSWPLLIAALPLLGLLYFGLRSSREFFFVELVTIALTLLAVWADLLPF